MNSAKKDFSTEFTFKTSRSSGKGGQHVNKTESRVSLFFNVWNSEILTDDEKVVLQHRLNLSSEGVFQLDCEESRSQLKNKEKCIQKFYNIISEALKPIKKRKATKPTKAAIRKRLKAKKARSEVKQNRKFDY